MRRLDRPHQGRHAGAPRHGVDVGAARQQCAHHVAIAGAAGNHQRRETAGLCGIGVRARRQQRPGNSDARVLARPHERRHAVVVGRVGVRAAGEQDLHGPDVIPMGRQEQRRHAVGARGVDVGARVEQRPNLLPVLLRRGVDKRQVGRPGSRCDSHQREKEGKDTDSRDQGRKVAHGKVTHGVKCSSSQSSGEGEVSQRTNAHAASLASEFRGRRHDIVVWCRYLSGMVDI